MKMEELAQADGMREGGTMQTMNHAGKMSLECVWMDSTAGLTCRWVERASATEAGVMDRAPENTEQRVA